MDVDVVRGMIGRGFRLGLYGHQHRTQASPHWIHLPEKETMAVVSAGSLCAGASELPPGVHRQYNVLEISDDLLSVRVHVRQIMAANLFGRAALNLFGGRSYATLAWEPSLDLAGRQLEPREKRMRAVVNEAEVALKTNQPAICIDLLVPHRALLGANGHALLLEAALLAQYWDVLIDITNPPCTIHQLVARVTAFMRRRRFADAKAALDEFAAVLRLDTSTQRALRDNLAAEEAIRQ
jgi:hypothetical protein